MREYARLHRRLPPALLAAILLLSVGCGGGSGKAQLRFMNACLDLHNLDLFVDGNQQTVDVTYGGVSQYLSFGAGSHHIQVKVTTTGTLVIDQNVVLKRGTNNTLLAENFSSRISSVLLTDSTTASGSGASVRVANAIPGNPIDLSLGAGAAFTNVAFATASAYQNVTPGSYSIFLTETGSTPVGSVTLSAGQVRTIVALPNLPTGITVALLSDAN